jgi:hypothetical protein
MKKTLITLLLAVLVLAAPVAAQTILTNTTLAAAVSSSSAKSFNLTSVTGVSAPSGSDYTKQTFLYVDRELVDVQSVSGTIVNVVRGIGGTFAASHASGAVVFVMPAYLTTYFGAIPQGSCTRGNELALPRIYAASGIISDCLGGQWINGDSLQSTRTLNSLYRFPDPGGTALTALETAGTAAGAATEQYCTEVDIPVSYLLTGLAVLNGTTVGTDKHLLILYDSSGNILANSAVAGATTSGASTYQKYNFTSKYYAVGPARYFACMMANGTTDTVRHAITAVNDNVLAGKLTGKTFGTVTSITPPSTFTTALGPYFALY